MDFLLLAEEKFRLASDGASGAAEESVWRAPPNGVTSADATWTSVPGKCPVHLQQRSPAQQPPNWVAITDAGWSLAVWNHNGAGDNNNHAAAAADDDPLATEETIEKTSEEERDDERLRSSCTTNPQMGV